MYTWKNDKKKSVLHKNRVYIAHVYIVIYETFVNNNYTPVLIPFYGREQQKTFSYLMRTKNFSQFAQYIREMIMMREIPREKFSQHVAHGVSNRFVHFPFHPLFAHEVDDAIICTRSSSLRWEIVSPEFSHFLSIYALFIYPKSNRMSEKRMKMCSAFPYIFPSHESP